MAISNWDSMALNQDNKPCEAKLISPCGVRIDIYKNWVSVGDEKAWDENCGFIKDNVMHITNAELKYKDLNILVQTKGYTVYLIAWHGWEHKGDMKGIIGIGTYGYDDEEEYIGVRHNELEELDIFRKKEFGDYNEVPKKLKELDLSKAKRYNQGDLFFHEHLGTPTNCSEVNANVKEPIVMELFFGKEKKN